MEKISNNCKCDCMCIHKEKTEIAINKLKEVKIFNEMSEFFKNFSDTTRLKILTLLDEMEDMCVNDIAVSLDMTKSAISHQLKFLKENKLVKSIKQGKTVFYCLADDHVKDILEKGIQHLLEDR